MDFITKKRIEERVSEDYTESLSKEIIEMEDDFDNEEETQHFESSIEKAEMLTGPLQIGVCFEVEAVKSVGNGESSEIDVLYDDVEFQYEIPKYLVAENRVYYVMTDVMGVCELEDDIDKEADMLSISTHNVGATMILYRDGKEEERQVKSESGIKTQYLILRLVDS